MANESIVASAIVYLSSDNLTDSSLHFRQACNYREFGQDDARWTDLCGIHRDAALSQPLGNLHTKGGRAVAFPNIYQHRVAQFRLLDATKPGRRRILIFFLVDPSRRVASTRHVPPQQRDWRQPPFHAAAFEALLARTPIVPDVAHMVAYAFDESGTVTLEQAKANREELMRERKFFVQTNTEQTFERPYSFCEH
jgi:hypothetical protein